MLEIRAEDNWAFNQLAEIMGYGLSLVKDWAAGKFEMPDRALRLLELETGRRKPQFRKRKGKGRVRA